MCIINTKKSKIKLWDLGGGTKFHWMKPRYCQGVDAILFVIHSTDDIKFTQVRKRFEFILTMGKNGGYNLDGIPLLFVFTKSDLVVAMNKNKMIKCLDLLRYEQTILKDRKVGCIQVSAKSGDNIDKVKDWMDKCNQCYFDFDRKCLFDGYFRMTEKQEKMHLPYDVWGICLEYYGSHILFE